MFGVGYVLVGDLVAGQIRPGHYLQLLLNGQPQSYLILEVEPVDRVTEGTSHTGLIIPYGTEEEAEALKALTLAGEVVNVIGP